MKLTIASGKGGTGKTTLSTNLSSFLAKKRKVVLVDLDVEEPNSGLFLEKEILHVKDTYKMIPNWESQNCTLCGKCVTHCNFNAILRIEKEILTFAELCHSCFACSELCPTNSLPMQKRVMGKLTHFTCKNFDFIEGRLNIKEEQAVPLISQSIDYVNATFNDSYLKIFDAPPGTSCPVIESTKESDFVLLVTESTPFGLNDLSLAVETMRVLKKEFGVVINRYGIGDDKVEKYCKSENIPVIAKIANDKNIAKLYSKGALIYEKDEGFKNSLEKISKYINELDKKQENERFSKELEKIG